MPDKFDDSTVYIIMAALGTLFFVLRLTMMLMGHGGHGGDFDVHVSGDTDFHGDHADHSDSTADFKIFSLLSVLAFFMGGGWAGLAASRDWQWSTGVSALTALGVGLLFMFMASLFTGFIKRMSRERTIDMQSCVGQTAQVYLKIPAKGQGQGQVQLTFDGRQSLLAACSNGPEIAAFTSVKVLAIDGPSLLRVEPA